MATVGELGAFSAAVVALGIAVIPRLWAWRNRPIFEAGCGESEPYVRVNDVTGAFKPTIRISVTNKGRRTAREVAVKIERWSFRQISGRGPVGEGTAQDIDPVYLRWITMPHALERSGQPPRLDLAPGSKDYVDVVQYGRGIPPELVLDDSRLPDKDYWFKSPHTGASEHWVQVSVTSENAKPIRKILYFVCGDGMGVFVRVHFTGDVPAFPSAGITELAKRKSSTEYTQRRD